MGRKSVIAAQDTDALLRDVVRLFVQAQRAMTSCCSAATAKECEAILIVGQFAPLTIQDFATRMSLEKTWASRLIGRLEKRRFLKRAANPNDARSTLIELTAAGHEERRRLQSTLNDHAVNLMSCVPVAQRAGVEQALVHLRDALTQCLADCATPETRKL